MPDLDSWLPELEPPPGGLARLRHDTASAPPRAHWRALAVSACGVLLLALAVVPGALERHRSRVDLDLALRQAVRRPTPGTLRVVDGAAIAIESGQSGVRLYLVQSARDTLATPAR